MWDQFKSWLTPNVLDEESQRIATLLTFIIAAFVIGVPVYGVVILVDDPRLALARFIILGVFVVFLYAMIHLMRSGQVLLVGQLLIAEMWIGLTAFVFIDNGIHSPAFHWYIIIIIVSGLITGFQGMRATTLSSIGISLIAVVLHVSNLFPIRSYDVVYVWALDVAAFVFAAVFLTLAINGLTQSLNRARQAEASWRTLVEENPDHIYELRRDALTAPADVQLHPILKHLPHAEHARFFSQLNEVFQTQQICTFEYSTGETHYSLRANPIVVGGAVNAAIVTIRDITENRLAESQRLQLAIESEKLKLLQSLVADVTHDMKTPLSTIETSLYVLQRANPNIEPERLERIRQQTHALNAMVQNLLTIIRLDHAPSLTLVPVSLEALGDTLHRQFEPLALQKAITFEVMVTADARTINADSSEIHRVFVNLLENAFNYTPEGGKVMLRAMRSDRNVVIEVEDTGIGFSEDDSNRVFERFFRSEAARGRVSSGSGLGLAIVKRIVELHGGEIEVKSALGQGTLFRVLLPQANDSQVESSTVLTP